MGIINKKQALYFATGFDNTGMHSGRKEAMQIIRGMKNDITEEDVFSGLKSSLAKIGGTAVLAKFAKDIVVVRGEFQKTQIAFNTMLGDKEKADALMAQIIETAAKTPFDLQGVADGAKQLLAYGTEADKVNNTLIRLGNIASGLSIPLNDIVYLYGTTMVQGRLYAQDIRQFTGRGIPLVRELAAMYGKTAEEINNMVSEGKIGFSDVEKVINKMTDSGGQFYNLMQEQSKTLSGQISNLGDAWDRMLNAVGQDTQDITSGTISMTTKVVENYETVGKVLTGLIATYGSYKAAVILTATIENMRYQATLAQMAGMTKMQVVTDILRAKTVLLNKTLLANPYALLTAGVIALVTTMWALHDSTTAVEKAAQKQSEYNTKLKEESEERISTTQNLINAIKSETIAEFERAKALTQLQELYPTLFKNMDMEAVKLANTEQLLKQVNEEQSKLNVEKGRERWQGLEDKLSQEKGRYDRMLDSYSKTRNQGAALDIQKQKQLVQELEEEARAALLRYADDMSVKNASGSVNTKPEIRNKTYWEKQKKEAEEARDALGIEQQNSAKWNEYSRQIQEAQIQIDKYSSSRSEKLAEQLSKYKDIQTANAKERVRTAKDLELQAEQSRIDAMEDGSAKTLAQMKQSHRNEIEELSRQQEDYLDKKREAAKAEFEADPANKGRRFNGKNIALSVSETDMFARMNSALSAKQANEEKEYFDRIKRSWDEYLSEYGSFQQKKEAITTLYNEKISKASIPGEKASLKKELEKRIKELNFDEFKASINFADVFGNIEEQSVQSLKTLRDKLKKYINESAKDLKPEDLKVLQDAFKNIDLKVSERTPFSELKEDIREYKSATDALDKAQSDLNTVMSGGQVIVGSYRDETGKIINKLLTQEQAERNLAKVQNERFIKLAAANKTLHESVETIRGYQEAGSTLLLTLQDYGVEVPKEISGIVDGFGQTLDGLASIDLTKPASIITGGLKALGGIGKAITGLFSGKSGSVKRYEEAKEQYEAYMGVLDRVIDKQMELVDTMKTSDYQNADNSYEYAKKLIESQEAQSRKMIELYLNRRSNNAHSQGYRNWEKLGKEEWDELSGLFGHNWVDSVKGDKRLSWLEKMDINQLEKLITAPNFMASIDNELREYIYNIIEAKEQLNDLEAQAAENLLATDFDSFRNSFYDLFTDLDSESKDFAGNLEEYMRKALLDSLMRETYDNDLKKFYDRWAELTKSDGGLTPEEKEQLKSEYEALVQQALAERDSLKDVFGWTSDTTKEKGVTGKLEAALTEGTASEVLGTMNMQAIDVRELKNMSATHFSDYKSCMLNVGLILEQTRSINSNTLRVAKNTDGLIEKIEKGLSNVQSELSEIKKNTKGYTGRG